MWQFITSLLSGLGNGIINAAGSQGLAAGAKGNPNTAATFLGMLGRALAEPNSWQSRLGQTAAQLGTGQNYTAQMNALAQAMAGKQGSPTVKTEPKKDFVTAQPYQGLANMPTLSPSERGLAIALKYLSQ